MSKKGVKWQHIDKEVKRNYGIIEYSMKKSELVASGSGFKTKREAMNEAMRIATKVISKFYIF